MATNASGNGIDDMLLAALERGGDSLETGRHIITYKTDAAGGRMNSLRAMGLRAADARDFSDQAASLESLGDADALLLPEIGVAVVTGAAFAAQGLGVQAEAMTRSGVETIEPEYFVFADELLEAERDIEVDPQVLGATWGLIACRVPPSTHSGAGIRVAVLDTGMDLGHPDFVGRQIVAQTFVGQPVQDLHSHGTHTIGTACGPKAPAGTTPRYGIGYGTTIFVGKVLTNSGSGTSGSVLAGMNWAVAQKCAVISMSLGAQTPVQAAYTAAGQAALNKGCLMIAAAGNAAGATGAPANSPTIVSVASLDQNLTPSSFSNFGKVEIAGPGRDVFSSVPRPTRYGIKSGTSMATPHVAGCAALFAQLGPSVRGVALRNRLLGAARHLAFPATKVGKGLVQAP